MMIPNINDIRTSKIMPILFNKWLLVDWDKSIISNGFSKIIKLKEKDYLLSGKYPIIDQGKKLISGYTNNEDFLYKGELPVIIFGDHTRVIKYIDFPFAVGADGCKIIRPLNIFDDQFFYYYLLSLNVMSEGYSRHYKYLKTIQVPLTPFAEQKRIVEKLDAILPRVKNAKAKLQNIPSILKRFRQSVLAAACSGRLTQDWREENPKFPEWKSMEFFDFFVLQRGYDLVLSKLINGRYPVLTSAGVSGHHNQFKIKAPGVVTGRSGSVGKVYFVEKNFWPHNTTLFVKDFKGNLPKYIFYFLLGFGVADYSTSTAVPTLNRNNLRDIFVNVPPLEEQHEIVRRVELLFKLADSIETKYKNAIARIEKVEQSVLAKAFRGELAEQDPNDEPAEELLKRILEEKNKIENHKPRRKK